MDGQATSLDTAALEHYLSRAGLGISGPIAFEQFTGGHSNLAFLIKAGGQEFVLKREPSGTKAKSAHDMQREYTMLAHISPRYPLAPKPMLFCEDETLLGGAFVLMQKVDGLIVRGPIQGEAPTVMAARLLALIDALADLHRLDVAALGLADFGRPDGYRKRQVEGWIKRFRNAGPDGYALAGKVTDWLQSHVPDTSQSTAVVHNDFKLDNLVWDRAAPERLAGVLDWEMATIGDPLMDLACTLSFWIEEDDPAELKAIRAMPSAGPGFPTRRQALERYAARTGEKIGDFDFYRCFGLFRRAAIEQQKFHRYRTGQSSDERFKGLDAVVTTLLENCGRLIST